jgi:hypothetical protein
MSKKILYLQENGKLAMISPAADTNINDCIPKDVAHIEIDESELPEESVLIDYFDALTINFSTSKIEVNLTEAKKITKDILRKQRKKLFEANDLRLRDAILTNDQQELDLAITERDRLRSITLLADVASSFDDLKRLRLV